MLTYFLLDQYSKLACLHYPADSVPSLQMVSNAYAALLNDFWQPPICSSWNTQVEYRRTPDLCSEALQYACMKSIFCSFEL